MARSFEIRLIWLIAFITIVNFLDRSAISYAILPMESELALNNGQFGIIAAGFGIGYLVMAFVGGLVVDRFNLVKIWAWSACLWSLATMAMGFARGFSSLLILRIVLGLAEGIHFPALVKTVSVWLEPEFRARSIAFGILGVPVASLIGAPLITALIEGFGWRTMFFILGLLGICWVVYWLILLKGKKSITSNEYAFVWKPFFSSRMFTANCFIYFVLGYVIFFALIWLPGYFEQEHGLSIAKTGLAAMAPWFASSVALLAGGWISDRLFKKTGSKRIGRAYPIAFGMGIASVFFWLLLAKNGIVYDLWILSLGLGFAFFINAPICSLNADLFPKQVGTGQGIMSCFFALAGIISPALTGWVVQISGTFQAAIVFVGVLTGAACLTSIVFQREP